jgi:hypothetical protein
MATPSVRGCLKGTAERGDRAKEHTTKGSHLVAIGRHGYAFYAGYAEKDKKQNNMISAVIPNTNPKTNKSTCSSTG